MCRFALYLGAPISMDSLITEPVHSIVHQSHHSEEREEPLNGDGFGVAWYVPEIPEPAVFRDVSPAWNNANLAHLSRVTGTACLLAHVRAASPGLTVSHYNCHPFSWGPLTMMHNGFVGDFKRVSRALETALSDEAYHWKQGSTDSELVFGLFIDHFTQSTAEDRLERLVEALVLTIATVERIQKNCQVEAQNFLNLAVADGQRAVVSRYVTRDTESANSLYAHSGSRYSCRDGVCEMIPAEGGNRAVIIASEPLSRDPGWTPIPSNHLAVVSEGLEVELRPIVKP